LEKWYNGYSTKGGEKLFNPFSISNALTEGNLEPYCTSDSVLFVSTDLVTVPGYDTNILTRIAELLRDDDNFRGQCQTLLDGNEIVISTNLTPSYAS
jgi:hypothetical protein